MKYFRFRDPEYALIAANSAEEAIKHYKEYTGYFPKNITSIVVQEQMLIDSLSYEEHILPIHLEDKTYKF